MNLRNLVIIGTSHIAKESVERILAAFEKHDVGVVGVELDPARLSALLSGKRQHIRLRDIRHVGFKGYLFAILGQWAEHKLGERVGMKPGDDMLAAVRAASERKIPIALIDQDIDQTLKEFSRHLTWTEKWRFVVDIAKAAFGPPQHIPFDLRTVPDPALVSKLTRQVRKRYPNVYKVLVTDRNEHMARRLYAIMTHEHEKTILAVVGAGHEEEIVRLLKQMDKTAQSHKH